MLSDSASGLIYFWRSIFSHCIIKEKKSLWILFLQKKQFTHTLSQLVHFSISQEILSDVVLTYLSTTLTCSYRTALGWWLFCSSGWNVKSNNLPKLSSGSSLFQSDPLEPASYCTVWLARFFVQEWVEKCVSSRYFFLALIWCSLFVNFPFQLPW